MNQVRRDAIRHAHMAGPPVIAFSRRRRTGQLNVNVMAQARRLTPGAKEAFSLLRVLSMPAVTAKDLGA